jgi:peptidase M50B-like protein
MHARYVGSSTRSTVGDERAHRSFTSGRGGGIHVYASSAGDAICVPFGSAKDGVVAAGCLVAPPMVGAALAVVATHPRRASAVLLAFSCAIAVSVALLVRSAFGGIVLVALAIAFAWVAVRGGPRTRLFFAHLLAVELGLDWLSRIDYFFADSANIEGVPSVSDSGRMAASFGVLPAFGWGLLLVIVSSLGLYASLRWSIEREMRAVEAKLDRRDAPALWSLALSSFSLVRGSRRRSRLACGRRLACS